MIVVFFVCSHNRIIGRALNIGGANFVFAVRYATASASISLLSGSTTALASIVPSTGVRPMIVMAWVEPVLVQVGECEGRLEAYW